VGASDEERVIPGLTLERIIAGASPRARLGDVGEPRRTGSSTQGSLRNFTFQMDSTTASDFYTISISSEGPKVDASCSCPFRGPGFCKHAVECLVSLIDDDDDAEDDDDDAEKNSDAEDDSDAEEDDAPPMRARRRREEPLATPPRKKRARTCARCGASFFDDSEVCVLPHRRVVDGRCTRCDRQVDEAPCFRGPHEAALAVVASENWPSSDDDDDDL